MKRFLTLTLALLMVFTMVAGFSACKKKEEAKEELSEIKEKGYFICGVTVYEPMNYKDADGNWTGFDTEFAQAVAKELGVEVRFQEIDWPNKYMELESGNIDVIWNGFTLGLESDGVSRTEYVDFTHAYLENRQCIVTATEKLTTLNTKDSFKGLKGVAEGGSSGEGVAIELAGAEDKITKFASQAEALMELIAGNADFAVIDYQMAKAMAGKGDYATLSINTAYEPASEVYAIGCRKGSDMVAEINKAIEKLSDNGTLAALAEKYGLTNDLIPNIGKAE